MESVTAKLLEMGGEVIEEDDSVIVRRGEKQLSKVNVKTLPYPGFPTDMNPDSVSPVRSWRIT